MKMRREVTAPLVISAGLCVCGCPTGDGDGDGDGDGPVEKESFECALGVLDAADAFVPAASDTRAELDLGFQGFLFVEVFVLAQGEVPEQVEASSRVTVEGEEATGERVPSVGMAAWESEFLSDPVLLFFNSETPADLAHKNVEVVMKLENDTHTCTAQGVFLLVDDDPCIHTGDEPICPENPDAGEEGGTR